jgi:hypothetical protein
MTEVTRSTFTTHPVTGAPIKIFIFHHPDAKRQKFSVGSRWESFKSFTTIQKAEAFFEAFI